MRNDSKSALITRKSKSSSKKYHAAGFTIKNGIVISSNKETEI